MRIDLVCGSLSGGGAQRVMVLLANKFAEEGHQVNIITFNPREDYEPNPSVGRVRLHKKKGLSSTARCAVQLLMHYRKKSTRPNIVISFLVSSNFKSIIPAKIFGLPVIACEHNNHLAKHTKLATFTRKYLYRHANVVTVLTNFDVPYYKKLKVRVRVMPNPSTFKKFQEPEAHLRSNEILAVGNLDRYHHKGFDNLIPLVAPVLKSHPSWKLKLVGGGEKGKAFLTDLAQNHGILEQVQFEGFCNNVDELMQSASIFVLSSRYEGLPMVLIEAMSQGMACVAYDCISGPSEIIDDGLDGLLVEDQNQTAMQNALTLLLDDPTLRKKLSDKGIEKVDKFKIDAIYDKWQSLFNELMD